MHTLGSCASTRNEKKGPNSSVQLQSAPRFCMKVAQARGVRDRPSAIPLLFGQDEKDLRHLRIYTGEGPRNPKEGKEACDSRENSPETHRESVRSRATSRTGDSLVETIRVLYSQRLPTLYRPGEKESSCLSLVPKLLSLYALRNEIFCFAIPFRRLSELRFI